MIYDGEKERRSFSETFDYVIVGSGASGATAARALVDTGASVAVIEEGPAVDTKEFGDKAFPAFKRMLRGMGTQIARGRAYIPILQGSCLGGSTAINSAIVWRLPDDVWKPWEKDFGLGQALPLAQLHKNWDLIEKELSIGPTPAPVWGRLNGLMDQARQKMGIAAAPTQRSVLNCRGSGRCLTGCPHGAKQSMLVSYLPYAQRKGAVILTSARVDRVRLKGNRAVGVEGHFHTPSFKRNIAPFNVLARKAVLIGASAIQTPGLLRRSGVRSKHLGEHFQAHPGCGMIGLFDQKVDMWFGATQGFDADHHRQDDRFKVEAIALPPEIAFARLPGVGRSWLSAMAQAPHAAIWAVQMRAWAEGRVGDNFMGTDVRYDLTPRDMDILRRGLRFMAEMFFAAGAREVIPGIYGMPERLTDPGQARLLEEGPDDPSAYSFILSHLFGTARMSPQASGGVVGLDFAVHDTKNLFVIDSSLFPTNIGVNPQHTIMAVAMHATKKIAERGDL